VVNTDRGKAEMDAIRVQLVAMDQAEADLREKQLAEMADAYQTALASGILSCALGIILTGIVAFLIRRATLARQRQEWLQSGQVGLGSAMLGDQRTEQLGDNILQFLARYLDAHAGALFVGGGDNYRRVSMYGVPSGANIPERFAQKEGLLGQAAVEGRPFIIRDVPDGYLTIASSLGQDNPRHLVISPAIADGAVNTVIELGFLNPISEDILALLDRASESVGVAVRSANYRAELQSLLEETQRQSEELQVQSEELRVSNEELEEQGRALKESQARLELQQAELEQTNAQLEEQAQQLEGQRDDLERTAAVMQLKARELEQATRYKDIDQVFRPIARERNLAFEIFTAPECPTTIDTDVQRLGQVLKNLLSNAFKFTEKGKVELAIRRSGDGEVALSVIDTGVGISEEHQQSVFEAFRQADGTISRKYGGRPGPFDLARASSSAGRHDSAEEQPRSWQHIYGYYARIIQPGQCGAARPWRERSR
jgi:hypothetical protein